MFKNYFDNRHSEPNGRGISVSDVALTILSATLLIFSFPKFEWAHLVWIGLVPFLIAVEHKSPKEAFWLGFILGFVGTLGGSTWIIHTLKEFGRLPIFLAIPIFLLFCLFNNLHFAIFGWVIRRFPMAPRWIFIPIAFTLIEVLFPQVFSWRLGDCLYRQRWLIQGADITGVYGFTFLILVVNTWFFEMFRYVIPSRLVIPAKAGIPKYATLFVVLLCGACVLYSFLRLKGLQSLMAQSPKIRAALVQTNVGNLDKFESAWGYPAAVQKLREINRDLVLKAAAGKELDLIVLPETAAPGYFTPDQLANRVEMFRLASEANAPIAFGGYYKTESLPTSFPKNRESIKIYNTLFLISNHFQVLGHYNKVNLLAFGEYFPLSNIFPFLKDLVPTVGDFARGEGIKILPLRKGISLAPLICLEAIYPNFVRKFIKEGANFIVTVTNDSWFGDTAAPHQHRMLHVWRTVENRAPMLRVANTGISTFIDLTGKIKSETALFVPAILTDEVAVISEKSFYTRFGNLFIYVLVSILIVLSFRALSFRARNH